MSAGFTGKRDLNGMYLGFFHKHIGHGEEVGRDEGDEETAVLEAARPLRLLGGLRARDERGHLERRRWLAVRSHAGARLLQCA